MKFSAVSFDLQGTLTDIRFSNDFWHEVLPRVYAKRKGITFRRAKKEILEKTKLYSRYDWRYYSVAYWISDLNLHHTERSLIKKISRPSHFADYLVPLLKEIAKQNIMLLIISSAPRIFIDAELGNKKRLFNHIFSTVDDFRIGGKTPDLYEKICKKLKVSPTDMLHIGDDKKMDVQNARKSGIKAYYFDRARASEIVLRDIRRLIR
ncbi:MAG: HAD family hydrolase [Candidatus Sungbacteria bacterium]|nr:HAD family hydrolase [Candidatus Sungbacteria bacterium]